MIPGQPEGDRREPDKKRGFLSEKAQRILESALEALVQYQPSEKCQNNVIAPLSAVGFDMSGFQGFVAQGANVLLGPNSQDLVSAVYPPQAAAVLNGQGFHTVGDLFKRAGPGRDITAITSIVASEVTMYVKTFCWNQMDQGEMFSSYGMRAFTRTRNRAIQSCSLTLHSTV